MLGQNIQNAKDKIVWLFLTTHEQTHVHSRWNIDRGKAPESTGVDHRVQLTLVGGGYLEDREAYW